jgi:hypothetical protein
MHFLGFSGMPRRIPDYPDFFFKWNYVCSLGSIISFFSTLYFFYVVFDLIVSKERSSINCWYNFILLSINFVYLFLLGSATKIYVSNINFLNFNPLLKITSVVTFYWLLLQM